MVDKLLTGFDVPKNTVIYLTRELRDHTLLQAIARVNRVEEGKDFGYIVDYAGVLENLEKGLAEYAALENFDAEDVEGAVSAIREAVAELRPAHEELWALFRGVNHHDREALEQFLGDDDLRKDFYERLSRFKRVLRVALSSSSFVNDPTNEKAIRTYRDDERFFDDLRLALRARYQEVVDFRAHEKKVRRLLDMHVTAVDVTKLTDLVDIFDDDALAKATGGQGTAAAKADLIAHAVKRTATERMDEDPVLYERFGRLIQQAIDDFRQRRINELEYLRRVQKVRDDLKSGRGDDVPEEIAGRSDVHAFYRLVTRELFGDAPSPEARSRAAQTATAMREAIERHRVVNLWHNDGAVNRIRAEMDDFFFDVARDEWGLDITGEAIDAVVDAVLDVARKTDR